MAGWLLLRRRLGVRQRERDGRVAVWMLGVGWRLVNAAWIRDAADWQLSSQSLLATGETGVLLLLLWSQWRVATTFFFSFSFFFLLFFVFSSTAGSAAADSAAAADCGLHTSSHWPTASH